MLKELLEQKKCFKLICGAGNENLQEVERLVALYSAAGCRFFDLSASEEVLKAAQRGLDFAISKEQQGGYLFCVSIGTQNDQHMQKATKRVGSQEGRMAGLSCIDCGICVEICPQGAIKTAETQKNRTRSIKIIQKYCIGCGKCVNVCPQNLIELTKNAEKAFLLSFLPSFPIACIELHVSDTNEAEVDDIWNGIKDFNGMLSICLDREKLGNEQVLNRVKRLIKDRKPYTTIIQADGVPMSGGKDDYKTTLQAVAMAEIIQNANLPVYILISGGTNSKTAELAKICGINYNGISIGSYARKIVKGYIEREDFLLNESVFNQALTIARNLIKSTAI